MTSGTAAVQQESPGAPVPAISSSAPSASTSTRKSSRVRPSRRDRVGVPTQILMWLYALLTFAPLLIVVVNSLRTNGEIVREPLGLPTSFSLTNYGRAWKTASMGEYLINSLIVTLGAVTLCLVVSAPLAYALARWRFPLRGLIAAIVLAGLMLPIKLGIVPIFYMFQSMGLMDSQFGLILIYAAEGVPFSVFVLMAFLRSLPGELEEAARIDGASDVRIFASVMLPLIRPALAAVVVFRFAPTWNDFFFPLVLLRDQSKYTIPVGMTRFFGEFTTDRGALYAGVTLALIPVVVLFSVAMKHIVSGLTAGIGK